MKKYLISFVFILIIFLPRVNAESILDISELKLEEELDEVTLNIDTMMPSAEVTLDEEVDIVQRVEESSPNIIEVPVININLEEDLIFDLPELSSPGEGITIDCVVTTENWDPLGVKIVFGPGEQVYLRQVSANAKHWQGQFTFPELLPEGEYYADFKILIATNNILTKKVKFEIQRRISGVTYTGNKMVSGNLIEKEIFTKPGEYFNPLKVESDIKRIYNLGFFIDISYNIKKSITGNIVEYILEENQIVEEIRLTGNTVFVDYTLLKQMQTKKGEIVQNEKLRKDIQKIEEFYQENQYIFAKVKEVRAPLPTDKKKILYIYIAEGRVGEIKVKGNKNTKDQTILREMELKTGDVFDRDLLQEDLRQVFNLNYFQNVYPDIKPRLESDVYDLVINVEEKRTNSINFGGGYGQLDGWFGFVDLFLDNLWGEAQSMLFKAQFGQLRTSYQYRYHNPWMWPNRTSFTGKLWSSYGFSYLTGYREQRNGWDIELGRPLSRHIRGSVHFLYEDVFIPGEEIENYKRRGIGTGLSYDTRDYSMNPTKGDYHVFTVDKIFTWFDGTVDSWKYGLTLERFFPLEKVDLRKDPNAKSKQVLATRLMGNLAQGDVLESEEFYVGSDNTVRGYNRIFARGRKRILANIEYRYLFNEIVQGVAFYDLGHAWETSSDFENSKRYLTGKGIGVRLITPIGPIRLDWGWGEGATFNEGYLHFSIG
ncbi:MAG: BamA/TamA family outer membrane protein, partial [Candidatus Margulisbacteria bacterium]|nr:BamA/TamA family outer membrane protein [Candidatus Margulisiibacteriota bacterium]